MSRERPILFSGAMVRAILARTKTQTRRVVKPQPLVSNGRYYWDVPGWSASGPERMLSSMFNNTIKRPDEGGLRSTGALDLCPYGQPGDRLWIKETWRPFVAHACAMDACDCGDVNIRYAADDAVEFHSDYKINAASPDWCLPKAAARGNVSPLFMPRWASRITLEVTDVRVERLQDISEADAIAEGVRPDQGMHGDDDIMCYEVSRAIAKCDELSGSMPVSRYVLLWDSINGDKPGVTNWNANPWVWVLEFKRVTP